MNRAGVGTNIEFDVVDDVSRVYAYSEDNAYAPFSSYDKNDEIYGSVINANYDEVENVFNAYFRQLYPILLWN